MVGDRAPLVGGGSASISSSRRARPRLVRRLLGAARSAVGEAADEPIAHALELPEREQPRGAAGRREAADDVRIASTVSAASRPRLCDLAAQRVAGARSSRRRAGCRASAAPDSSTRRIRRGGNASRSRALADGDARRARPAADLSTDAENVLRAACGSRPRHRTGGSDRPRPMRALTPDELAVSSIRLRAAQRSHRHRRAVHRPPAGHGAAALPRRRPSAAGERRRRADGALAGAGAGARGAAVPVACGARSRWAGCGSARRSTTATTRIAGIAVAFLGHRSATLMLTLALASAAGPRLAAAAPRRGPRPARGRARRASSARPRSSPALVFAFWFLIIQGPAPTLARALTRRFLDYYRQFDELSPDEISASCARGATRSAPAAAPRCRRSTSPAPPGTSRRTPRSSTRRRSRCAARSTPTRTRPPRAAGAIAARARHRCRTAWSVGHGAGELLRARAARRSRGGDVAGRLAGLGRRCPRLVHEAGGRRPGRPAARCAARSRAAHARRRALPARRPDRRGRRRWTPSARWPAGAAGRGWLIARRGARRLPARRRATALVEHPRVLHVRSFSKAHAMAGFRVGYAIVPEPATWCGARAGRRRRLPGAGRRAVGGRERRRRRRAAAAARPARERERLAAALAGSPLAFPAGHGPYVWLLGAHAAARWPSTWPRGASSSRPGAPGATTRHVRATLRDAAATTALMAALARATD